MTQITKIKAREILDSRGNPTVEVDVHTTNTSQTASVPSGASTGTHEAVELRDNTERYNGKGVTKAIRNINSKLTPLLLNISTDRQREIDHLMIEKDNTHNKSRIGANAMLPISLATARCTAAESNQYLFEHINQLLLKNKPLKLPRPFFNVINGGKHAGNTLVFQEFMISPKATTFKKALQMGTETYHVLKQIIKSKYGPNATNIGDEGGFAPPIKTAEEALTLLTKAINKAGYKNKIHIAMDAAASEFYKNKHYHLPKKTTPEQLLNYYLKLTNKFPIISLEDPFHEEDFVMFAKLKSKLAKRKNKVQIVGDDLTVTNSTRIKTAIENKSCDCLLLKVNQIGTLTEALDAVRLAYENNWKVMVSHRSGETTDTFIADLAVGIACGQIKAGAPCRGERTAKYNRLLRIEEAMSRK